MFIGLVVDFAVVFQRYLGDASFATDAAGKGFYFVLTGVRLPDIEKMPTLCAELDNFDAIRGLLVLFAFILAFLVGILF